MTYQGNENVEKTCSVLAIVDYQYCSVQIMEVRAFYGLPTPHLSSFLALYQRLLCQTYKHFRST